MTNTRNSEETVKSIIMNWIFPGMVSLLIWFIYQDVSEIKADVKAVREQSTIDKTRIDNLQRQVYKTSFLNQGTPTLPNQEPIRNYGFKHMPTKPDDAPLTIVTDKKRLI